MSPPRRTLPSILPAGLRRLLWFSLVPAAFLAANTVYLVLVRLADLAGVAGIALGDRSLPAAFQVMVLSHTGVGILLVGLILTFLVWHLPVIWKRRHRASVLSGAGLGVAAVVLLVTGLYVLTDAASRDNRWVWWVHVIAAAGAPSAFIAHRFTSYVRPSAPRYRRGAWVVGVATAGLLLIHVMGRAPRLPPGPGAPQATSFHPSGFVPLGFVDPAHPFFPSPVVTASGGVIPLVALVQSDTAVTGADLADEIATRGFVSDRLIGASTCERCHADIVEQWAASAHRFASFNNPFYEASVMNLRASNPEPNRWVSAHQQGVREGVGVIKSRWCAGCHDPSLLLTGRMNDEVDRGTVAAQAGITCTSCHRIDSLHDRTGNANYQFRNDRSDPYLFSDAPSGTLRAWLHDAALKAKPAVHRRRLLSPLLRESEFCATCHKVSLTEPLNDYRWVRGQNEFDNWDDSGVALNAARTFYLPPTRRICQDCHMPPEPAVRGDVAADNGMVRSHRFVAANTALPFLRGDTATIRRTEEFLRDERLSAEITGLAVGGGEARLLPSAAAAVSVPTGTTIRVDVVVRNRGVGHTFPGGTNDSNEGWLEFTVVDEQGEVIATHGAVAPDGTLDPMAHVYKAVLVDKAGEPIHARNAQDIRATVFANVIPPGNADLAHYEFTIPDRYRGQRLQVRTALRWRKFDHAFTSFAFQNNRPGFASFDEMPSLPVTDIAGDTVTVVADARSESGATTPIEPDEWVRINDYGIALLREGNTRAADRVFATVATLQPERVDGPLNRAKVALRDGNLAGALEHVDRAETVSPRDPRVAWVWGVALQEDGQHERAVAAYRRVLETFPRDRATWRNLGRTYYLDLQYDEALRAFAQVLAIDPEDRIAHFHRMLIYRAQGRDAEANQAAAAADYYSIDEAAQELTRRYRSANPGANLMTQPIRVHEVVVR